MYRLNVPKKYQLQPLILTRTRAFRCYPAMECATVIAGNRTLRLSGLHSAYLQAMDGTDTDKGLVATAIADLATGSILLDVGANVGFTAIPMAVQRPDCQILAFEPVPANADCLRRNIQTNGISNIKVFEVMVSDVPGTAMMTDSGPWSFASPSGKVRSRSVTLDDYFMPAVRFIKIDVEGYEPNVLAGAAKLLSDNHPLLCMEFNSYALLLHHYDPLIFAEALWTICEVVAVCRIDVGFPVPQTGAEFLHMNMTQHQLVSDLLLRPRGGMPDLATMTEAPATRRLRADLAALYASRSWRITAPLRALRRSTRRIMVPERFTRNSLISQ